MAHSNQNELEEIIILERKTTEMLEQAQAMFHIVFDGLMKNDIDILNQVLKDEEKMTGIYNDLTAFAIEAAKKNLSNETKNRVLDLIDIISFIEEIGDSCVDLVEQIEYKIRENLLFSEVAVQEYKDLHNNIEKILSDIIRVMKTKDSNQGRKILESKFGIDALVDKYRANHIERSAKGICSEWARIRYLEMLNITQRIAHYCMDITEKIIGK